MDPAQIRQKLKVKSLQSKSSLTDKFPDASKFFEKKGLSPEKIREHSAKLLGAGALTGTLLLSPPSASSALPPATEVINKLRTSDKDSKVPISPTKLVSVAVKERVPVEPRPLSREEEKHLEKIFETVMGVKARATLEGEHLNQTYGYIGIEQHLRRYPGDTLSEHGEGWELRQGIAPGLGAWGYFANSESEMTEDLVQKEKWYAVVQTLYLPDWNTRTKYLREWYKYRKVLIVNVENGNAVVADVADSGPAAWTGKQYGGSPEVMNHLGGDRYTKGKVIVFFVDDPNNKVPLGPVIYDTLNLEEVELLQL